MPSLDISKAISIRKRPGIEILETRDLLATIPLPTIPSGGQIVNLPAVQYALEQLYGPSNPIMEPDGSTIPSPQPSTLEVHREFFELKTFANYTITSPRFPGQEETIHGTGTRGSSNQFLVGRPQIIFFPSTDSVQPATGIIHVIASNFLFSGAAIILDLTETPVDAQGNPDPNGLYERGPGGAPEHFTWTLDPTSGSVYTGSTGTTPNPAYAAIVNPYYAAGQNPPMPTIPEFLPGPTGSGTGAGVLNIVYKTDHRPSSGTMGSGLMTITASGLTNVPGINNTAAENFS